MVRAAKPCTQPGCPQLQPCPQHHNDAWSRSNRSDRLKLTSGSAEQRRSRRVIQRDNGICYLCHQPGADQADHVIALAEGGNDDESNMRAIHARPCHQQKTAAEAARAQRRARQARGGTPDP